MTDYGDSYADGGDVVASTTDAQRKLMAQMKADIATLQQMHKDFVANPPPPMGAGSYADVNIVDGTQTLPIEVLQPEALDPAVLAADVAATIPQPLNVAPAAPTPEERTAQLQTQVDTELASGTGHAFSSMGNALLNGNLSEFWFRATYTPKSPDTWSCLATGCLIS